MSQSQNAAAGNGQRGDTGAVRQDRGALAAPRGNLKAKREASGEDGARGHLPVSSTQDSDSWSWHNTYFQILRTALK